MYYQGLINKYRKYDKNLHHLFKTSYNMSIWCMNFCCAHNLIYDYLKNQFIEDYTDYDE